MSDKPRRLKIERYQLDPGEIDLCRTVDLCSADRHAGPGDCYGRQHVNTTGVWARIPGREDFPWSLCGASRSMAACRRLILEATDAEDALRRLGADVEHARERVAYLAAQGRAET